MSFKNGRRSKEKKVPGKETSLRVLYSSPEPGERNKSEGSVFLTGTWRKMVIYPSVYKTYSLGLAGRMKRMS